MPKAKRKTVKHTTYSRPKKTGMNLNWPLIAIFVALVGIFLVVWVKSYGFESEAAKAKKQPTASYCSKAFTIWDTIGTSKKDPQGRTYFTTKTLQKVDYDYYVNHGIYNPKTCLKNCYQYKDANLPNVTQGNTCITQGYKVGAQTPRSGGAIDRDLTDVDCTLMGITNAKSPVNMYGSNYVEGEPTTKVYYRYAQYTNGYRAPNDPVAGDCKFKSGNCVCADAAGTGCQLGDVCTPYVR